MEEETKIQRQQKYRDSRDIFIEDIPLIDEDEEVEEVDEEDDEEVEEVVYAGIPTRGSESNLLRKTAVISLTLSNPRPSSAPSELSPDVFQVNSSIYNTDLPACGCEVTSS